MKSLLDLPVPSIDNRMVETLSIAKRVETPPTAKRGETPSTVKRGQNPPNHQEAPLNIDLTNFDPHQVEFLLSIAANLQPQAKVEVPQRTKAKPEKPVEDEAHSGANFVPRREKQTRSVFSRLGSSQETHHPRHGGDHHNDATWKDNKKQRDLRRELEAKRAEYEREKRRIEEEYHEEKEKTPEPTPINEVGSSHHELLNTLMELKRKVEGGASTEVGESPFTKRLENESKQRHLKHPNLNSYDGLGDPEEHLSYFDQLALFYEYKDLTRCRFFASTLRGSAQRWFCRIIPRSLDTWADFKKAFLGKFKANQPHEVHTVYLETIAQKSGKTLESYLARFKQSCE